MISQTGANYYLRSWDFSVSNDNKTWTPRHSVSGSDILEPNETVLSLMERLSILNERIEALAAVLILLFTSTK